MVHTLSDAEADQLTLVVAALERQGLATATFRRLDAERQYAIVSAVLDEAAGAGPGAVAMKAVAARAGVSVGALYRYFPDRDTMVLSAAAVAGRFLAAELDEYAAHLATLPLRQALLTYLGDGIEWTGERVGPLRFFARAAYGGEAGFADALVKPVAAAMVRVIRAILSAARDRGELRAELDLDTTARLVHALTAVVGDSILLPFLGEYTHLGADTDVAAAVDFVLAAIRATDG